jgi:hypothetical protein
VTKPRIELFDVRALQPVPQNRVARLYPGPS